MSGHSGHWGITCSVTNLSVSRVDQNLRATNVIVATNMYAKEVQLFYEDSPFQRNVYVDGFSESYRFFSKPQYIAALCIPSLTVITFLLMLDVLCVPKA